MSGPLNLTSPAGVSVTVSQKAAPTLRRLGYTDGEAAPKPKARKSASSGRKPKRQGQGKGGPFG
jgi:hypothetical protein